jgi:VanZ family protein
MMRASSGSRIDAVPSLAGWLAAACLALIVYASLHPFEGWTWPARPELSLLWLPTHRYHTRFDVVSNFVAYVPAGLLLAVAGLRHGVPRAWACLRAFLWAASLSLCMEWLQILLPQRVPSREDWVLNAGGAAAGAALAWLADQVGAMSWWQGWRDRWFDRRAAAGLVLVLLWPVGLLFPPPLPLALGQVAHRAAEWLAEALAGTALAGWVPFPAASPYPLSPGTETLVIAAGLLAPCFVAFAIVRPGLRRLALLLGALSLGAAASTLSTLLNFGPDHALGWMTPTWWPALVLALLLGLALCAAPRRLVAALGLMVLTWQLGVVNELSPDPYFAQSLQGWEQGRFIRFHGAAQWVGWGWPLAALIYLLARVLAREPSGPR